MTQMMTSCQYCEGDILSDIIIPVFKKADFEADIRKISEAYGISSDILLADFQGAADERVQFRTPGTFQKLYLVGLGPKSAFGEIVNSIRSVLFQNKKLLTKEVGIDLSYINDGSTRVYEAILLGAHLSAYNLGLRKTQNNTTGFYPRIFLVKGRSQQIIETAIARAGIIAASQMEIMDLVNLPSNHKYPEIIAKWVQNEAQVNGYHARVLFKEEIEESGLHALHGVSKGSEHDPAFIILEYGLNEYDSPLIGLVGKGVTFDTGGISIKGSQNMHFMKSDMGGAAAVLGAFQAISRLKLPVRMVGLLPMTENTVDGNALKPGDVIRSYSGHTIEVIDTDAEGRLILADGISYAIRNYKPDLLLDLATLTGSCVQTLGYHAAGVFTHNDELADALYRSGMEISEKLWRLPLWDVYASDVNSDIADIKNFSGKPVAGAIQAAKFLEFFTEKHPAWAHIDMAGVVLGDSEYSTMRSATGYGVGLLLNFIEAVIAQNNDIS